MKVTRTFSVEMEVYNKLKDISDRIAISASSICNAMLASFVKESETMCDEEILIHVSRILLQSLDD